MANTISILIQAKDEASRVLEGLGGAFSSAENRSSSFTSSLGRIRDVALGVYLPQLAGDLLSVGKNAISSAGDFEQYRVAFETMLGSASKAQQLLTQISQFAKETPFELPEVVTASKQLLAFGFAQEQIIPTLRKLGDVAAGVGVPVGQLAAVYGQVRTAGKLMGQDLLQFTEAGVPLLDYLGQVMHKTTAQIKNDMDKGVSPSFDQVQQALDLMTQKGSKFGGMMDAQSHTFKGVMSNISDAFGQVMRGAVGVDNAGNIVKDGLFDRMKQAADSAMPALQNFGNAIGPWMTARMNDTTMAVHLFIEAFKDPDLTSSGWHGKMEEIGNGARYAADALQKFLGPSLIALKNTIVQDLWPSLQKLMPYLDDFAKMWGAQLVAGIWLFINALNLIAHVISGVIDGFFHLKNAIGDTVDWIAGKVDWCKQAIEVVFLSIRDVALEVWNGIKDGAQAVFDAIVAVWDGMKHAASVAWNAIYSVAVKPILDAISFGIRIVGDVVTYIWQWIAAVARLAWNEVYVNAVQPVLSAISVAVQWLGNSVAAIWNWIASTAASAWNAVWAAAISPVINAIVAAANWCAGVVAVAWNWIAATASTAWNAVSNAAGAAYDWVRSVWNGAVGWFSGVGSGIAGAMNGPANSIRNTFSSVFDDIKGAARSAVNWIINKINDMIGAVNGVADKVPGAPKMSKIPTLYTGARNFQGGLAVVGDVMGQGGELVSLPKGSNVYSNRESKQMLAGGGLGGIVVNIGSVNNNVDVGLVARQIGWQLALR